MLDLFSDTPPWQEPLAPGAVVLRRFARERAPALLQAIADVASQSPFRQMVTPGGYTMSVAMTNCGALGWMSDKRSNRCSCVGLLQVRCFKLPRYAPSLLEAHQCAAAPEGRDENGAGWPSCRLG